MRLRPNMRASSLAPISCRALPLPRALRSRAMKSRPPAPTDGSRLRRSNWLDAGLVDDVTPFRHLTLDALAHAVGAVGENLAAVITPLLGDLGRTQNSDRLGR